MTQSKLISMSLYGDIDMYIKGAIENIKIKEQFYPDWKIRIYCSEPMPQLDCETVVMGDSLEHSGMFWRFLPIWESGIDAAIFRDTDSRFNLKESKAVEEWLNTDFIAHSMHDHEHHRCYPLFGGMFGIIPNTIPNKLEALKKTFLKKQPRVADMIWLQDNVWPFIKQKTLHHSSVSIKWESKKFPFCESGYFVGQQFGDEGAINP